MAAEMVVEVSPPASEQSPIMGQQPPTQAGGFMPVSLCRLFLCPPRYNPRDSSSQSPAPLCFSCRILIACQGSRTPSLISPALHNTAMMFVPQEGRREVSCPKILSTKEEERLLSLGPQKKSQDWSPAGRRIPWTSFPGSSGSSRQKNPAWASTTAGGFEQGSQPGSSAGANTPLKHQPTSKPPLA